MIVVKYPVALISTFLWIGFVCAISFMEAWLKFRAPGVTLPVGLGIGRIVFSALNKVEWVFAIAIIANILLLKAEVFTTFHLLFYISAIILLLQTFWALPLLDARAELHIQGHDLPASNLHFLYVGMEAVKVICLAIFGISLLKSVIQ